LCPERRQGLASLRDQDRAFAAGGIDGTEDNAGALSGPDGIARATDLGISAKAMLANNDGYGFFSAIGDLVITGPPLTNVNDFRAILVLR
jgi:glycerate 2-kinase